MNGIEKITQRISAEAQAECGKLMQEAEERCAAIKAEYEKKAEAAYNESLEKGKQEIEQTVIRANRAERLNAKKEVLGAKQEIVNTAFDKAKEKLLNMQEDEYVSFLAGLAAKASVSGTEKIVLSAKDAAAVGAKTVSAANAALSAQGKKAALSLSEDCCEIDGGLILKEGSVEVNCSVDAMLSQCRGDAEAKLVEILFG